MKVLVKKVSCLYNLSLTFFFFFLYYNWRNIDVYETNKWRGQDSLFYID